MKTRQLAALQALKERSTQLPAGEAVVLMRDVVDLEARLNPEGAKEVRRLRLDALPVGVLANVHEPVILTRWVDERITEILSGRP